MGTRETKDRREYFPYEISSISPDVLKAVGTATLSFEGARRSTLVRIKLTDRFGSVLTKDGFRYLGGGYVIQMSGSYASPKMKLSLTEGESDVRRTMDGTLEYAVKKYVFIGGRLYGSAAFNVKDPATGNVVGSGWLTWQHTPSRANEIVDGASKSTDRIVGLVTINGTSYRNAEISFMEASWADS